MPFVISVMMVISGFLSYLYLKETFKTVTYITPDIERQTWLTLSFTAIISLTMQVGGCIVVRKVHLSFK